MDLTYPMLIRMAANRLHGEFKGHPLEPNALVNEVYLHILQPGRTWTDPQHLFKACATAMHHILVDYARKIRRETAVGGLEDLADTAGNLPTPVAESNDRMMLDSSLELLSATNARGAEVVKLLLTGMTQAEAAKTLGIAVRTVKRDYSKSKEWLRANWAR